MPKRRPSQGRRQEAPVTVGGQRRSLLAQVHIAKKELGLDDGTYRAVLWEQVRRESAGEATLPALEKLLRHFEAKGWKKKPGKKGPARAAKDSPQVRKIRALWLKLAEAGAVRDPSEAALRRYVKRQTQVDHLAWLDTLQARTVIESLKQWARRLSLEVAP